MHTILSYSHPFFEPYDTIQSMITPEMLRTFMTGFGWPVLVFASIYILAKSWLFYRNMKGSPFGKLVLASTAGWLITMYSLGVVSTFYLFRDISSVRVVFPVFVAWFVTLVIILHITMRWSKETTTLHAFYTGLEIEVKRRTTDLEMLHKRELENAKKIQQLKDEILFVAAHELRSPLSAIKWGLQTILEDESSTTHMNTDTKEILKNVYEHNEQLYDLVTRLLNTARIEQGVLAIKTEQVFPLHIIREVLAEVQHLAHEQNIRIQNDVGDAPSVLADPTLFKEVLTNLLTNAIRYNVQNGAITITEKHTEAMVAISVTDTGQGIPADQLTDIFQKFHHIAHKKTLGKEKSVGLGLYISKELVTRMGGTIRATSELGKGSTFTFTLPRDRI